MPGASQVLFHDGEGLEYTDLNLLQDKMRAEYLDALARGRASGLFGGLVAMSRLGGIKAGGSALQVTNDAGVLMYQAAGTIDLATPRNLVWYLAANDLQFTCGAAHATLDRIDAVYVKLELVDDTSTSRDFLSAPAATPTTTTFMKRRGVTLTAQLVAGTPATPATVPAAPGAGYVLWGAVRVPPTHAAVFTSVHLMDYRDPGGQTRITRIPADHSAWGDVYGSSPFGSNPIANIWAASAANQEIQFVFPDQDSRIRLFSMFAKISGGGERKLERVVLNQNPGDVADVASVTVLGDFGTLSPSGSDILISGGDIQYSGALVGPIWGSGFQAPAISAVNSTFLRLRFKSGASGDFVSMANMFHSALP